MTQNQILTEILDLYKELVPLQEEINRLVQINRELLNQDKDFTESIESYFSYLL